ncbi:hypothetical protein Golob_000779 [Gossypium lobatum]|uniref:Uncharacterized protein n=1 Tax=Gossypium lobatum TaxID=34289 RepID=A0A7J8N916_9ROSI|nr:hypothetical protein [Gossypium lobatum]
MRGVLIDESSIPDNFISMKKNELETYIKRVQKKTILQEWGFEFQMDSGSKIWNIVRYYKWENFGKHPIEPSFILVVQEFYALLNAFKVMRPLGEPWSYVTVKGREILILSLKIYRFYNIPFYMYDFIQRIDLKFCPHIDVYNFKDYLTEGREEWQRDFGTNLPITFTPSSIQRDLDRLIYRLRIIIVLNPRSADIPEFKVRLCGPKRHRLIFVSCIEGYVMTSLGYVATLKVVLGFFSFAAYVATSNAPCCNLATSIELIRLLIVLEHSQNILAHP